MKSEHTTPLFTEDSLVVVKGLGQRNEALNMLCWATQDGWVMVKGFEKHDPRAPINSMKRQKEITPEYETPG